MWQEEVIRRRYPEKHVSLFSIIDIRKREMFS